MSLHSQPIPPVPEETARVAHAAFAKGNLYLTLRDELGVLYEDEDFHALYPQRGQPALFLQERVELTEDVETSGDPPKRCIKGSLQTLYDQAWLASGTVSGSILTDGSLNTVAERCAYT